MKDQYRNAKTKARTNVKMNVQKTEQHDNNKIHLISFHL